MSRRGFGDVVYDFASQGLSLAESTMTLFGLFASRREPTLSEMMSRFLENPIDKNNQHEFIHTFLPKMVSEVLGQLEGRVANGRTVGTDHRQDAINHIFKNLSFPEMISAESQQALEDIGSLLQNEVFRLQKEAHKAYEKEAVSEGYTGEMVDGYADAKTNADQNIQEFSCRMSVVFALDALVEEKLHAGEMQVNDRSGAASP